MLRRVRRHRGLISFKLGPCIYFIGVLIANQCLESNSVLFGRRPFHRIKNDPGQVRESKMNHQNLFEWMNLKNQIKFRLWTKKNPILGQILKINDHDLMTSSNFNASHPTKILVHGYAHSANELFFEEWLAILRDAYLSKHDLNVVIVDYTFFALPQFYMLPGPVLVAQQLAQFITFLEKENLVQFNQLHLIGYSWGAHIVGNTGHYLGGRIGRITGLDPANPLHRYVSNDLRLDKSDAQFVDVIHTNCGGPFSKGFFGLEFPLAHADFYPNGGKSQPGCPRPKRWIYIYDTIECDHLRSVTLFTESILFPEAFPACQCPSWDNYLKGSCHCPSRNSTLMGESTDLSARGTFYLRTKGESPYGLGK